MSAQRKQTANARPVARTRQARSNKNALKQAPNGLHASKEDYRMLVEQMSDALFIADSRGYYIDVNPAGCRLLGYAREELIGKHILEVTKLAGEQSLYLDELRSGKIILFEREMIRKDGTLVTVEINAKQLPDGRFQGIVRDITARKQAEERLLQLTRLYATLSQVNQTIVRTKSSAELYQTICKIAVEFGQFSLAWIGLLERTSGQVTPVAHAGTDSDYLASLNINLNDERTGRGPTATAIRTGKLCVNNDLQLNPAMEPWRVEASRRHFRSSAAIPFRLKGGTIGALNLYSNTPGFFSMSDELHLLEEIGLDISFALDTLEAEAERQRAIATLRQSEERYRSLFENMIEGYTYCQMLFADGRPQDFVFLEVNKSFERLTGLRDVIGQKVSEVIPGINESNPEIVETYGRVVATGKPETFETYVPELTRWFSVSVYRVDQNHFVTQFENITERKRAEAALRKSEEEYRLLFQNNPNPMWVFDPESLAFLAVNDAAVQHYGYSRDEFLSMTIKDIRPPEDVPLLERQVSNWTPGIGMPKQWRHRKKDGTIIDVEVTGHWTEFGGKRARIILANDITQRKRAEEQLEHQLDRLSALRAIDATISTSFDLRLTLDVVLDKVLSELHVDAAAVLLLNPQLHTLEYFTSKGFRTNVSQRTPMRVSEDNAGRVAMERRVLYIPNLRETPNGANSFANENFVTYYGVPLIAKGQVKGVLEIYQRTPFSGDDEWLDFMEALAGQAAIAIDSAQLFVDLQRSNFDLELAYDATIEGWSRALDLRDKETEGHTLRVVDLTLEMVRAMGLPENEMVHIRRGALLHDIGKMGVPDAILLKPDKLTDEEWTIMRRHPTYAYEMLSPIAYLRPALDIPYGHHERWDGTGYPRKLRGAQIPLAARIFALVDVWDALSHDRPYRPAWETARVMEYIQAETGKHFDPQVVDVFFKLVSQGKIRLDERGK